MTKIAEAGNVGKDVRSDCKITLEITKSGGLDIEVISKVDALFGDKIKALCEDVLKFFNIKNANLKIEDSGALDYIIAARIEAAVKKLISTEDEYLLPVIPENNFETERDTNRRSRLYLPGNTPKLALNAGVHNPDGIILDLEDSVAPDKKFEARILVRNALRSVNFYGGERMVRINQLPLGLEDLDMLVNHNVNLILLPKCESADQIKQVNAKIKELNTANRKIWIMPIIESALGVVNSFEIASAENVVAVALGLEDYTADIGTQRTNQGLETFYARTQVVNSARAAKVQPIDSVFSDVSDMEALKQNVLTSKSLGFDGMGCIHPRQIAVIHENFAPNEKEIEKAMKIVNAFMEATEKGLGVVALGSKMIDPPVVKRAEKTIEQAISAGKLNSDWRENYGK